MTATRGQVDRDAARARPALGALLREHADVALLVAFIVALGAFGRPFTKLGAGDANVYITEVVLVLIAAATLARHGIRGAWRLLRERLPWVALLAFWAIGAYALARGLADYSLKLVSYDVAMVEYSVLVPLIALVVDTRRRLELVLGAVAMAGLASVLISVPDRWLGDALWPVDRASPAPALTLYVILFIVWVAVRLAEGVRTPRWLVAAGFLAVVLIGLEERRSAWVALIVAVPVIAVLAYSRRRALTSAAVATAVIAVGMAISIPLASVDPLGPATWGGDGGGGTDRTPEAPGSNALKEVQGIVSDGAEGESENVRWRLDMWRFNIENSVDHPLFGVGFGEPTNFHWRGRRYDVRTGDPAEIFDVTGPHNDFVHYVQRMGWLGLAAVLAIVAIAIRRVWPWVRRRVAGDEPRAIAVTLIAMLAATATMASLNDALKGPFMGVFWWVILGLMLVVPFVLPRPEPE